MKDISNTKQPLLVTEFIDYMNEESPFNLEVMAEGYFDDGDLYGEQSNLPFSNPDKGINYSLFNSDGTLKDIA